MELIARARRRARAVAMRHAQPWLGAAQLRARQAGHLAGLTRALPDFLVIGAQRSGTTSLFEWLAQHPAIHPPTRKEVHFFDGGRDPARDVRDRGLSWYAAHFPARAAMAPGDLTFEVTPSYLFVPDAAPAIAAALAQVRLIAILRDPTERAVSHYRYSRRRGIERLPMAEAFRTEAARLAPLQARGAWRDPALRHGSYLARGRYADQIERYLAHVPRERLLVLGAEAVFAAPEAALARVLRFVGADPGALPGPLDAAPRNAARARAAIEPGLRAELDAHFAPHNRRLFALIGESFGWPV